jgi:branched-chain amino acid aminotransferase
MKAIVSIDGRILPAEEATVSVLDRGFLYGDSVFEVLRTYGGVPFAMEEHLARLARSAERTLIRLPVTLAELRLEIEAALAASGYGEALVRIMISRGRAGTLGLDPSLAKGPLRVILVADLHELPDSLYTDGAKVITYPTLRIADATTGAGAKIANYLVAVLAMAQAKEQDAEEALVLNAEGLVAEGCTSNVFLVKGGALATPPESLGILLGITREHVLSLARELGIPVTERAFPPSELAAAEEAFITSSIREVVPVVRIDDAVVATGKPGPVTRRLIAAFRKRTRGAA